MHEPQELSYAACRGLLASGVVGRVAVTTPEGPRIFTVNYSVVDESVIFRTSPHGLLGTYACDLPVAFLVDSLDYGSHRGWSVLAVGQGQAVQDPKELAHIRSVWEPQPWAAGHRPSYVRLAWDELTGIQLGLGQDPKGELPVRPTELPQNAAGAGAGAALASGG